MPPVDAGAHHYLRRWRGDLDERRRRRLVERRRKSPAVRHLDPEPHALQALRSPVGGGEEVAYAFLRQRHRHRHARLRVRSAVVVEGHVVAVVVGEVAVGVGGRVQRLHHRVARVRVENCDKIATLAN